MPLTDIAKDNQQEKREETDDYTTCGMIIGRFQAGQRPADIARALKKAPSTIADCIKRWKKTGSGIIQPRKGRPLKLSERDERAVVHSIREEPFLPF
ncbi:hypothetical protein FB192DRAFT_1290908, partial [Mucor lusitanicus]